MAGFVHGGFSNDRGSFAKYVKVDGDLVWRIPEELSDEEASTYGVAAVTAMLALNIRLGLSSPSADQKLERQSPESRGTILIHAGSTTVGLFAIQLAKSVGYRVVTTASPRSYDLVKRYGADRVFDYRSSTVVEHIVKEFPIITNAFDCISEGPSTYFCTQVLKTSGGKVVTLYDQGKSKTKGVEYEFLLVFTAFGHDLRGFRPLGQSSRLPPLTVKLLLNFRPI